MIVRWECREKKTPRKKKMNEIEIKRTVLSEQELRRQYSEFDECQSTAPKEPFDWRARCYRLICPFVASLRGYNLDSFLRDVIAGLTVACIRLPQGLAYGALASIPPIHGLYTGS